MITLQILIIIAGLWMPLAIYTKIAKRLHSSGLSWRSIALDLAAVFVSSAFVFGVMTFALSINTDHFGNLAIIARIAAFAGIGFTAIAIVKIILNLVIAKATSLCS